MANMRILIRMVFAIFIANGIDCLGVVRDNCCDCCCDCCKINEYKGINEYEEIKNENENITAESLVNKDWFEAKKENLVLKIFKKEDDNFFISTDYENKISINNHKIAYLNGNDDPLKLSDRKYAFFGIITKEENPVYLYCSDVESNVDIDGIFINKNHKGIYVISCDTAKVTNMGYMFYGCKSLTKLNIRRLNTTNVTNMESMFSGCSNLPRLNLINFYTKNVTNMQSMFSECSNLEKLDISNFKTENVTNMGFMFHGCSKLTEIYITNFNTKNVTNMKGIFYKCSSLENLDISKFNTTNVTNMNEMFFGCSSLKNLKYGQNFNTSNVKYKNKMFDGCKKLLPRYNK